MNKPILLLNAPPRAGKDTLAMLLERIDNAFVCSFKQGVDVLADAVLSVAGIDNNVFKRWYDLDKGKARKELGGMSCRQFYIHLSESLMKPIFGNDVFGKCLAKYIAQNVKDHHKYVVVADVGFEEEVETLADAFGRDNLYLVQWTADWCSYLNDSRKHLDPILMNHVMLPHNEKCSTVDGWEKWKEQSVKTIERRLKADGKL